MRSHRKLPFFLLRKVPTPRTDRGGPDSRSSEWGNNYLPKLGPLAGLCRVSLVGGTAPAGHPAMTHLACTRTADLPPRMRRGSLRPTACSLHHEASPPQFSFLLPESPPTARLPFPPVSFTAGPPIPGFPPTTPLPYPRVSPKACHLSLPIFPTPWFPCPPAMRVEPVSLPAAGMVALTTQRSGTPGRGGTEVRGGGGSCCRVLLRSLLSGALPPALANPGVI